VVGEALELAGVGLMVAVLILPDLELVEPGITGVDPAVEVAKPGSERIFL